jgi:hypothetical protein
MTTYIALILNTLTIRPLQWHVPCTIVPMMNSIYLTIECHLFVGLSKQVIWFESLAIVLYGCWLLFSVYCVVCSPILMVTIPFNIDTNYEDPQLCATLSWCLQTLARSWGEWFLFITSYCNSSIHQQSKCILLCTRTPQRCFSLRVKSQVHA